MCLGLVDSANSFYNAMSLAIAARIGLTFYQPYEGPPVGTALAGSTLDIVWVIKNTNFAIIDESEKRHLFSSRLVIVKHLSCGLNISLAFLVENGLDQLHSQSVLLWTKKQVLFPLYRNMMHARKFLPSSTMINSVITLGDSTFEVSNKNRQIVPPCTGKVLNATVNGKAIVQKQADKVFSYKNSFINKIHHLSLNKEHLSQDENYFSLNSLDQAKLVKNSNKIDVYFIIETNTPIIIR